MVKEMAYMGYHVLSVEKLIESENQTYITRINVPNPTELNIENVENLQGITPVNDQ